MTIACHAPVMVGLRDVDVWTVSRRVLFTAMMLVVGRMAGGADHDAFYVWQRAWTPPVCNAVREESSCTLLPLLREFTDSLEEPVRVQPDWGALAIRNRDVIPVIRVSVALLGAPGLAPALERECAQILQGTPPDVEIREIQLDIDCPERLLNLYAELGRHLREALPGMRISATILPCHAANPTVATFAKAFSTVVLQVHGLAVPKTWDDPASLLDPDVARRAIEDVDAVGCDYRVALPTYAYTLHFNPETGRFLRLSAEPGRARNPAQLTRSRILSARPEDVSALVRDLRTPQRHPHCRGIIWFRLPVPGDRLCLDRRTVADLQGGRSPEIAVETRWQSTPNGTFFLELTSRGVLGKPEVALAVKWGTIGGEADLINGFNALGDWLPGTLPEQVTGWAPAPGETVRVGWFRPRKPHTPTVEVTIR